MTRMAHSSKKWTTRPISLFDFGLSLNIDLDAGVDVIFRVNIHLRNVQFI